MYKKVLVILHESILPNMSKPALMIDFLTAAYEVGKKCKRFNCDSTLITQCELTVTASKISISHTCFAGCNIRLIVTL